MRHRTMLAVTGFSLLLAGYTTLPGLLGRPATSDAAGARSVSELRVDNLHIGRDDPRPDFAGDRPLVSTDHRRVHVPGDYDTPQEAIDREVAVIMRHQLRIVVRPEDPAAFADHHVRIPAFLSAYRDGDVNAPYDGTPNVGAVRMYGDRSNVPEQPAVTQLGSVWIAGGIKGLNAVTVEAFNIMGNVPGYRRDFGIVVYGDTSANIWDISFLNSGSANGVEAYEADLDIRRLVGGDGDLRRIFRQKGAGFTAIGFNQPSIPTMQHIKADWGLVHVRRQSEVPVGEMRFSSFDGGFIFDHRTGQMLDFAAPADLSQLEGIRSGVKRLNDGTEGAFGWYFWHNDRWRAMWDREETIVP